MSDKVVFVVGSGASAEVGLPVGEELKDIISQELNINFRTGSSPTGNSTIIEVLRAEARRESRNGKVDINPYLHSCRQIIDGLHQAGSIDNFIDAHQGSETIELCGKLAIVESILASEKSSQLYFDNRQIDSPDWSIVQDTWFNKMFKMIVENCQLDGLDRRLKRLTFIVFNYDRCIEYFLYHSFQNYYGISSDEAARLVNLINIVHPYGYVGRLPWHEIEGEMMSFGEKPYVQALLNLTSQIKTFTEGTDESTSDISLIKESIATSTKLVFLGFAFHPLNMKLIKPENNWKVKSIFGTGYGMSDYNCQKLANDLKLFGSGTPREVHINNNVKCADLFDEYRMGLLMGAI